MIFKDVRPPHGAVSYSNFFAIIPINVDHNDRVWLEWTTTKWFFYNYGPSDLDHGWKTVWTKRGKNQRDKGDA